jgi:hypothetical protein
LIPYLQATLQRLQQYITLLVLEEGQVNVAMQAAVELMDLFHAANLRAKHVSLAAFYNDAGMMAALSSVTSSFLQHAGLVHDAEAAFTRG